MALVDVQSLPNANPYNLGAAKEWSHEDLSYLKQHGAFVNPAGYVYIPQANLWGQAPLGLTERRPGKLHVGNKQIVKAGRSRSLVDL